MSGGYLIFLVRFFLPIALELIRNDSQLRKQQNHPAIMKLEAHPVSSSSAGPRTKYKIRSQHYFPHHQKTFSKAKRNLPMRTPLKSSQSFPLEYSSMPKLLTRSTYSVPVFEARPCTDSTQESFWLAGSSNPATTRLFSEEALAGNGILLGVRACENIHC